MTHARRSVWLNVSQIAQRLKLMSSGRVIGQILNILRENYLGEFLK